MKKFLVAAMAAAGLLVAAPAQAGAMMEWCDWDPIVPIITPAGNVVLLYDSVWTTSPLYLGLPISSYTVSRVYGLKGQALTAVDVVINVPTGLLFRYSTLDMVTTGPLGSGQVLASATGSSGTPVHLKFTLNKP
jgi:hypothetical protein